MGFAAIAAFSSQYTDPAKPHYFDRQTAHSVDGDPHFEWRNGGVAEAAIVYRSAISSLALQIDQIEDYSGAGLTFSDSVTFAAAVTLASTLAVTGAATFSGRILGGHSTTAGAGANDWIIKKGAAVQSQDGDGATSLKHLIGAGWTGTIHTVNLAASGQAVGIGAPSTFSGSSAGDAVLDNLKWLRGAYSGTAMGIARVYNGALQVGDGAAMWLGVTPFGSAGVSSGEAVLGNGKALRGVNAAGTSTQPIAYVDSSGLTHLGYNTSHSLSAMYTKVDTLAVGDTALRLLTNTGAAAHRVVYVATTGGSLPAGAKVLYVL